MELPEFQKALGIPLQVRGYTVCMDGGRAALRLRERARERDNRAAGGQLYAPYFCPTSDYFSRVDPSSNWTSVISSHNISGCNGYGFQDVEPSESLVSLVCRGHTRPSCSSTRPLWHAVTVAPSPPLPSTTYVRGYRTCVTPGTRKRPVGTRRCVGTGRAGAPDTAACTRNSP